MRGGGKADGFVDTSLTCQGSCGTIAWTDTGFCGCDAVCSTYGDCCDDKVEVCDGGGAIVIPQSMNGETKTITIGDTIDVQLPGNPSTGYAWKLLTNSKSFPLQKEEYVADEPQAVGSGGVFHFYFTGDVFSVGYSFELRFAYQRGWEGGAPLKTFTVTIVVTPSEQACSAIDSEYQAELPAAGACSADSDCQTFVGGSLTCGHPLVAINAAHAAQVDKIKNKWMLEKCYQVPWNCPLFAPMPPWLEPRGVCDQGTCKVEIVDTRGQEGSSCGDDIGAACADGLYCAFGDSWCGTPPRTGVCREVGSCGTPSDCYNQDNGWIHPMCLGEATCDAGRCGWKCTPMP